MLLRSLLPFLLLTTSTAVAQPVSPAATPSSGPSSKDLFDAIHVVVGPSGRALDPIALSPSACPRGESLCDDIDRLLDRDLTISGYFKVLPRESYLADSAKETLASTSWPDWFNVGAKYLIKVQITENRPGLSAEFRLFNVTEKRAIPVKGQSVARFSKRDMRKVVHQFVNGVIEVVTGKPGIFGTQIVLSLKAGLWERNIVAMDMDGFNRHNVVANGSANMFPKWAPGGGVVYTSFLPGKPSVYLGTRRITQDEREYRGAAFSRDGRLVASVDMGGQSDLVQIDPKSGAIIKTLTSSEWDEVSPSWSPDGRRIAFVSSRSGSPQVHVISADGTGERRVTMAGSYNSGPRFGPNGLIAFSGMDGFQTDIFTVDPSGNLTRLTQNQGNNKDPAWSPDGRYLVFLSSRDGEWKVFIMTEDGRYQFPITESAAAWATPDWGY